MDYDIFDNGIPKYTSAQDIYDAVQTMASGEEIGIISEMFGDVSCENQDYYYTDNGGKLMNRWETMTDYGAKMWLMDIAVWQIDGGDANDWVYEALYNEDFAKRIGFKKLFVDAVLGGESRRYKTVAEAFEEELHELDRFGFQENSEALSTALGTGNYIVARKLYNDLCSALYGKLKGLRLDSEKQLIVESRALLTAYDDFMFGLKSNQYLYNQQEAMYQCRVAELKAGYDAVVKTLLASAQAQGVVLQLPELKVLEAEAALGGGGDASCAL